MSWQLSARLILIKRNVIQFLYELLSIHRKYMLRIHKLPFSFYFHVLSTLIKIVAIVYVIAPIHFFSNTSGILII